MLQTPKMTHNEKVKVYSKISKRKLIEMLIECNHILDIKMKESNITTFDTYNIIGIKWIDGLIKGLNEKN